jgi:hypothetical protein
MIARKSLIAIVGNPDDRVRASPLVHERLIDQAFW